MGIFSNSHCYRHLSFYRLSAQWMHSLIMAYWVSAYYWKLRPLPASQGLFFKATVIGNSMEVRVIFYFLKKKKKRISRSVTVSFSTDRSLWGFQIASTFIFRWMIILKSAWGRVVLCWNSLQPWLHSKQLLALNWIALCLLSFSL